MNIEKIFQIRSTSSAQTEQIGEQIGSVLRPQQVIELTADLGGGKTTFVKGLAKGLGHKGVVTSPTFTICREYQCQNNIKLYHYDFYRLDSAGIMATEFGESIRDKNAINVIEWAGAINEILPNNRLKIILSFTSEDINSRLIEVYSQPGLAKLINKVIKQ